MQWHKSHRADPQARVLADRHYNRQKPGSPQFVPPGRCLVLLSNNANAVWVTSWPFAEYVRHEWPGAWICSAFRNESSTPASLLIRDALAATKDFFGDPPILGIITFIDCQQVRPTKVRGKDVFGWTWKKAGFAEVGYTKGGLLALQCLPQDMPPASPAGQPLVNALPLFARDGGAMGVKHG